METVMKQVYDRIGIDYNTYVTTINKKGVEVQNANVKMKKMC